MLNAKPNSGTAAAVASATASSNSVEFVLGQATSADKFCTALAKMFAVRQTEVALMRLEKGLLRFIFPDELKTAGSIPVSSSSAIAAHTATAKKSEMFNSFAKVKHASIFETVKLAGTDTTEVQPQEEQPSIQKLMSAPIISPENRVVGVLQVCRKGFSLTSAGPDFTLEDTKQLELAAKIAGTLPFMK
jgi:hypothetical protein